MFDKWIRRYREHKLKRQVNIVGSGLEVFGQNILIQSPNKLCIGNNLKINSNVLINARGGVDIGNNVTLSDGCKILSTGYDLDKWKEENIRVHKNEKVVIGDNVWICANAIICPGISILGSHVVVAAGAVVTKDIVCDNCIVGGNPARIIKML